MMFMQIYKRCAELLWSLSSYHTDQYTTHHRLLNIIYRVDKRSHAFFFSQLPLKTIKMYL